MVAERRVRYGILGVASINARLIPAMHAAGNTQLVGIASRREGVAADAGREWNIPRTYDGYEALLADPEIEAVYIPLPNHLHAEWAIRAAQAGKHVLCEKPLALTTGEVGRIRDAAQRSNVQVMEGFMYRFLPRWQRTEEIIRSGVIGDLRVVRIGFAFRVRPEGYNIRFDPEIGGGVTWDIGSYVVNMARTLLAAEPTTVFAAGHSRPEATVDTSVEAILRFPDDRAAIANYSFDYHNPYSQVEIVGTEGWLAMPGTGFWYESFSRILYYSGNGEVFCDGIEPEVIQFEWVDPYMLEVRHFSQCVLDGTHPRYGLDDALANTRAVVATLRSMREGCTIPIEEV